jgi:hypothetical protein
VAIFRLGIAQFSLTGSGSIVENGLSKLLTIVVCFLGESGEYFGHFGRLEILLVDGLKMCDKLDERFSRNPREDQLFLLSI